MWLGQSLPPTIAHRVIDWGANIAAGRRQSTLYRTVYANQAHVLGPQATVEQIDADVRRVIRHGAQCSYDLMRSIAGGEATAIAGIEFTEETWRHIEAAHRFGRGVVVCGCHLSNFNLGMLSYSLHGTPVQILSRAQPAGGFKLMTDLRDRGLLEETPIDGASLRKAILRLRAGGSVGTAVDWPQAADPDVHLTFFGAPALLPTGHVRLALTTNAVFLPISARWSPERGYYTISTPAIELERTGDRASDLVHNAERVLAIVERWISETPDQWLMYYPVWPEGGE